jgi:hypothetical protein
MCVYGAASKDEVDIGWQSSSRLHRLKRERSQQGCFA